MKRYYLSNPAHRAYFDTGIAHKAILLKGNEIGLCPTRGHCLSEKWKLPHSFTVPVGMWRKVEPSEDDVFEVESIAVCASKGCRRPIDVKSKKVIDRYLHNTPVDREAFLADLDSLLEGL